jgi:hypothetical protein
MNVILPKQRQTGYSQKIFLNHLFEFQKSHFRSKRLSKIKKVYNILNDKSTKSI